MTTQEFKQFQEDLGLSNEELANKLHCNVSHIGHIRAGRREVTFLMEAFLNALKDESTKTPVQ